MVSFLKDNLALNKTAFQQHPYKGLSQDLADAYNEVDEFISNFQVYGTDRVPFRTTYKLPPPGG